MGLVAGRGGVVGVEVVLGGGAGRGDGGHPGAGRGGRADGRDGWEEGFLEELCAAVVAFLGDWALAFCSASVAFLGRECHSIVHFVYSRQSWSYPIVRLVEFALPSSVFNKVKYIVEGIVARYPSRVVGLNFVVAVPLEWLHQHMCRAARL